MADTAPFAVQAEVTLKTNFFATRDMLTHFLPIIKAGGNDTKLKRDRLSSLVDTRSRLLGGFFFKSTYFGRHRHVPKIMEVMEM